MISLRGLLGLVLVFCPVFVAGAATLSPLDIETVFEELQLNPIPVLVVEADLPNAGFGVLWDGSLVIILEGIDRLPRETQFLMLLHEIGHYAQWLEGDWSFGEWDADRRAVQWGCQKFGIDGAWFWDLEKVYWDLGLRGKPNGHGELSARITHREDVANKVCPNRQLGGL